MSSINFDLTTIKAMIFDVDGVLSSEMIPLHPSGEPMRMVNTKDGYAIQLAAKKGFQMGIITGGNTDSVRARFESLRVQHIYLGSKYKMKDFYHFLEQTGLKAEEVMYMGDDIPDYEIMKSVGLPACPSDAVAEIKAISKYISHKPGGMGCARDVVEQILKSQGHWMADEAFGW